MPKTRKTRLIAWNQAREQLRQELEELLTYLPPDTERMEPLKGAQFSNLNLISLAALVGSFRRHYPKEKVIDILLNEGGLTALLAGDETHLNCLRQEYLD